MRGRNHRTHPAQHLLVAIDSEGRLPVGGVYKAFDWSDDTFIHIEWDDHVLALGEALLKKGRRADRSHRRLNIPLEYLQANDLVHRDEVLLVLDHTTKTVRGYPCKVVEKMLQPV